MNTVPNVRYNNKHEAIEDAKHLGASVKKVGETNVEISTEAGKIHLTDDDRQISKCDSEMIRFLFWGLRLFGAFIAIGFILVILKIM